MRSPGTTTSASRCRSAPRLASRSIPRTNSGTRPTASSAGSRRSRSRRSHTATSTSSTTAGTTRVATAEDPASARYGESFWAFLPRTVTGSIRSAWRLEKARLERLGHSPWTRRNEVLHAWAMTVVVGHRDRDGRQGRDSVPRDPGRLRRVAARSRELRRALRASAAASCRTAATNAARRSIRGTAITSSPTCSCTSCSGTPTITRIRRARTRRCATSTMRRNCRPATRR